MKSNVVLVKTDIYSYPSSDTFRPSVCYPEYLFKDDISNERNHIYDSVREGFCLMNYDIDNYGTKDWNPLGDLINPGNTVVIKPNLVMDVNPSGEGTDCLFTQPSLVAAVIDYVVIALKGKGEIIIGDAPMQECNFSNLIGFSGYKRLLEYYSARLENGIKISLVDFRELHSVVKSGVHHSFAAEGMGIVVDLKNQSEFSDESDEFFENIRITNYDPHILRQHHNKEKNEYYVNSNILRADVIINMPKPKTHRKAGVTIAMKNLVGINARKEYLPHHTNGSLKEGGDEYLEPFRLKQIKSTLLDKKNYYSQTAKAYRMAWIIKKLISILSALIKISSKDKFYEGSWYGNDTISRTIVDLNKILFYADKNGVLKSEKQRKYLIVADMIISGEKEGPVMPSAKKVGIIAMGENPVCFDEAIAKLMGAKIDCIPTITHARKIKGNYRLTGSEDYPYFISNDERWNKKTINELDEKALLYFQPTSGWVKAFLRHMDNI